MLRNRSRSPVVNLIRSPRSLEGVYLGRGGRGPLGGGPGQGGNCEVEPPMEGMLIELVVLVVGGDLG